MTQSVEMIKINPADYAVRLHTTLNRLHEAGACADGYRNLVECLGGVSVDHDAPINLLTILEHNGTEDCLWALCATTENCDQVARLMAADFAEAVLPIFEAERPGDDRPRLAINAARGYAIGTVAAAARDAAWAAARAAAGAAVGAAAWAAAKAAAWAAAGAAARAAAGDAAWAAAGAAAGAAARAAAGDAAWAGAWAAQADTIRRYLLPDAEEE